tara:strand:+ start:362 stop:718 length:357 start_codon:yes stop_codon:yes gene_type:complete
MSYNQGTGDLQRSKTAASVTLGGSNGAASVSCEGTRISLTVTLSANFGSAAIAGPVTINNPAIKATSVIESCVQTNHAYSPFDVFAVQDGSCKLDYINYTGGTVASGTATIFSIMIYN